MREILFRAKDRTGILNHSWLHGSLENLNEDFWHIIYKDRWGNKITADIDINTVGQFTGLIDKNGRKLFEGDIVKLYLRDDVTTVGDIRYSEEDCRFKFWEDFEYPYGFDITTPFEVIGNIHDNPELLGE